MKVLYDNDTGEYREVLAFVHKSGALVIKSLKGYIVFSEFDSFESRDPDWVMWNSWLEDPDSYVSKVYYEGDKITLQVQKTERLKGIK